MQHKEICAVIGDLVLKCTELSDHVTQLGEENTLLRDRIKEIDESCGTAEDSE